jgi:acyl-CoA synthetase (AMP-forming)/AMP-acid ligase II
VVVANGGRPHGPFSAVLRALTAKVGHAAMDTRWPRILRHVAAPSPASSSWLEMVASHVGSGHLALRTGDGTAWTYDELLARAAGAAEWLDSRGVQLGIPLPAFMSAGPTALALLLAGAMTGRPLAPLSPRFSLPELATCLNGLPEGPIIADVASRRVAEELAGRTGRTPLVAPDELGIGRRALTIDSDPRTTIAVVHTSGTTGLPKPVAQCQGPLTYRVSQSADPIHLGPGSVYATASAFHHQAGVGLILVALGSGATLVPLPQFSVENWKGLEPMRPTHATVVPALLETLLAADALSLPSLRWIQYGSSPLHPTTAQRLVSEFPALRLVQQMGQTEGSPVTTLDHQDHVDAVAFDPHRLESIGRPVGGSVLRIEDMDADGVGEICSKAAHYFAPDPDGWLRTGDLGHQDDDGFVYLVGRRNDAINRGGETIYPLEVERVIATHPLVLEVAVAGRPDRRLGQVPHAFVVAVDDTNHPSGTELAAFARERLSGYKVPRDWHFVDELPRNPSGKILRRLLAQP